MSDKKISIADGAYESTVIGLGKLETDKSESIKAKAYTESDLLELARMKVQDGITAGIVERPVETAFKEDISIIGDEDGSILKAATEIGLLDAVKEAGEYIRLCGGAVVVCEYEGVENDNLLKAPSPGAKIKGYWVYSAGKVHMEKSDFDGNTPKFFRVELLDGSRLEVDPSRCYIFKGPKYPDVLGGASVRERFFGVPSIKKCEKSIKNLAGIFGAAVNMAIETGVLLCGLENFNEILSNPETGVSEAHKLLSLIKLGMSSYRAVVAGQKDNFSILSHNFAGIPELIQKAINEVSADSRIPVSILFGQSATGLAQTNEGDSKSYGEMVESFRSAYLYRPMCLMLKDFAQRNLKKNVSEFDWGEVCPMTTNEELEAMKMQMEIVEKAINLGIITPDEARQNLFVNGHSWTIAVEGEVTFNQVEEI